MSNPKDIQCDHYALKLNFALKLNQKAQYVCWLPTGHLSNIPITSETTLKVETFRATTIAISALTY